MSLADPVTRGHVAVWDGAPRQQFRVPAGDMAHPAVPGQLLRAGSATIQFNHLLYLPLLESEQSKQLIKS